MNQIYNYAPKENSMAFNKMQHKVNFKKKMITAKKEIIFHNSFKLIQVHPNWQSWWNIKICCFRHRLLLNSTVSSLNCVFGKHFFFLFLLPLLPSVYPLSRTSSWFLFWSPTAGCWVSPEVIWMIVERLLGSSSCTRGVLCACERLSGKVHPWRLRLTTFYWITLTHRSLKGQKMKRGHGYCQLAADWLLDYYSVNALQH